MYLLLLAARLLNSPQKFPLLGSLAYMFLLIPVLGWWLGRGPLGQEGEAKTTLLLGLATLLSLLLIRLNRHMARYTWLWFRPDEGDEPLTPVPDAVLSNDQHKQLEFAAAFQLTRREHELLTGILQNQNLPILAQHMDISLRTARFHLSGLLKKLPPTTVSVY